MTPLVKPPSRASEKRRRVHDADRQKRETYRRVSERDGYQCRACGRRGSPTALSMLDKLHHHEIRFRSLGGRIATDNVVLLCADDHAEAHARRLIIAANADGVLTFEREGRIWTS